MASAARDLRYRQSVDGSLARELDWAVRERELRHAGEAPRRRERETERIRAIPRVQLRQRQHVSLFSVVGHIQLTVLSSDTVALKEELEELESQNVILTAQYERMFDLTTVREAAEAAGMSKPSSSQICYLDISGGDSAVVYQKEEDSVFDRVLAALNHGVYSVVEYFQ